VLDEGNAEDEINPATDAPSWQSFAATLAARFLLTNRPVIYATMNSFFVGNA
jgi:hypothetical protein